MEYGTRKARNILLLILLALIMVVALIFGASKAGALVGGYTPPPRTHWMKVQCPEEDGVNCSWNANSPVGNSNGTGHSFYVVQRRLVDSHGQRLGVVICVYYVKMTDHHWDACHLLPPKRYR